MPTELEGKQECHRNSGKRILQEGGACKITDYSRNNKAWRASIEFSNREGTGNLGEGVSVES